MLGAAWSSLPVPALPYKVRLSLALVLELGIVEPDTLLRLSVQVVTPTGTTAHRQDLDVAVPAVSDLVKRAPRLLVLDFEITELGRWRVEIHSSTHTLGHYDFECRQAVQ